MFIFSIRTFVVAVAVSASCLSGAATLSAQSELLCSPEGLMRLIPQFNVNGQFTIPDPNADLQTFLSAQQGLSNAVDMILTQESMSQNPSDVGSLPSRPLVLASSWLSSEVGIQTDGSKLNSPEAGGKFGGHRVQSFLTGLTPVPLSQGTMYVIKQSNPTYQALVYPMPTSHPCVNRLYLAADNTAGFGRPDICSRQISARQQWPPNARQALGYLLDREHLSGSRQVSGLEQAIGFAPKRDDHSGASLAM